MTPFPRSDYADVTRYDPQRAPVELDLSDNTNLWGAHPEALKRIRRAAEDDLARYPELYADSLRLAVSERFGVAPECVTTGAGSDDVLDSAFRAAWGPDATVTYPAPTFSMVEPLARMNGLRGVPIDWSTAREEPSQLLESDPDLVYVCRPNNPTGELLTSEWVEELLAARGTNPPLIILDEAYADFAGETLLPRAPQIARVLVTRTASKAYGLAGLRCGFAVGEPDVALAIEKSRGPYKVSRLASEAAAAAIRDDDGWMADTIAQCIGERGRLFEALTARGLRPLDSSTNFVLFRAPTGAAVADALTLREFGVGVRPFVGIPDMDEGLRVTVAPAPEMERFLAKLDTAFDLDPAARSLRPDGGPL
jgi:histidinol-phosphate aminotransferase